MCERIAHRGPDGQGLYLSPGIALGHTRLALVDLEGGAQPYVRTTESGTFVIVFNGEIYNHRELRAQLANLGWRFETRCDTEVLLVSYLEWGERCLEKLRGMFAFAIWEERTGSLFCARDPFGIKPFYYARQGKQLIFASEPKSILAHPSYRSALNHEAFEQYLCFQFSALPETMFKGIFKLPAACWLRVDLEGNMRIRRYWTPRFAAEISLQREEAVSRIEAALRDSVRVHAQADVPVGSLLSGGIDSSYLAALLKQEDVDAQTFSVSFSENKGFSDEVLHASQVAQEIGIANSAKRISEDEWWSAVDEVLYHMDEPIGDPAAIALYFVDMLAASHVKSVLSGEGADELFGGYCIYKTPHAARKIQWFPRKALHVAEKAARRFNLKGQNYLYRATHGPKDWYYTNANQVAFSPDERRALLRSEGLSASPQSVTAPLYAQIAHADEETQMQYVDMHLWLVEDILLKTDRMSMAHSLESRVPFLDKRVFEVAASLPARFRVDATGTKLALREAAGRVIPRRTASREKLGFPVPLATWFRKSAAQQKLTEAFQSEVAQTYFDTRVLQDMMSAHAAGKDNSRRLWIVYAFLVWHRLFLE